MRKINITRLVVFGVVAALHCALLFFLVLRMDAAGIVPDAPVPVMKLTDLREAPPPPPPPEKPPQIQQSAESVAQNMVETEELPPELPPAQAWSPPVVEDYLPMHKISARPVFDEAELLKALVYPPIAQRSSVEGMAYLELFIDRQGNVRRVEILKETPEGYGFGEAAAKIFRGRAASAAQANGQPVAVRFRYPVRFKLKG
ncbi:MAG: energy transducer TonB [Spirochaetales bacterium]|jgi:protein TonB|nr:energy transducer TonB [Spirochaetales bacterium]